ncbi:MAG: NADH-quinone oxidoreductase subunit NuoN [Steroidobacteraceae bacterium]
MNDATFSFAALLPALPEIYLTFAICALLLIDVFMGPKHTQITGSLTLVVLAVGALLTMLFATPDQPVRLFDGMYIADRLATLLKLAGFLFVAVGLYYSSDYLHRRGILKGEYYVLALTALLGIFVLASAGSMLTVYIGIELLSLSLYALVAFDRASGVAAEAAMKYFVLGAIASGTLLYGMSIVYGLTGSLDLIVIAQALSGPPSLGLILGVVFIVVAVAFKFGAAPFHMWVPDVYQGAPVSVTLLVATAPKLASFALAFRMLTQGLEHASPHWTQMLAIIAVLSIALGNIVAIAQTSLLRMLAYSAIANVGFVLFGFVAGTPEGYQAALYYTLVYVLMVLGSFGVVLLAGRGGFEADEISHYKGLSSRDPSLALMMLMLMFSTAGVPPFVGFWAKLGIIQALLSSGHVWLAAIAVFFSVIGAFYYLRIVWVMYFDSPDGLPGALRRAPLRLILGINALVVLVLGLLPDKLLQVCAAVIGSL